MENVAVTRSNPFGIRPSCTTPCSDSVDAVFSYGDPNADFHLIGDRPEVNGGMTTGIPFTDQRASERLLDCLDTVGIADVEDGIPERGSLFMSYLHMCCSPDGVDPTTAAYTDLERLFDAEFRAVAAHVLLPVGRRAIAHVLEQFTAVPLDGLEPEELHATELAGRGFLVVPIADPRSWHEEDEAALLETLADLVASDYHQEADLTRFFPTSEQYLVR